jgi:drug/metabolite transporter (DMT)-like permease
MDRPGVSKTLIYGIAIFANLLWAGAYVTGKIAIGTDGSAGFGPFRAAFFRFAAAGAVLALWGLVRAPESLRVRREDLPRFGRLALLGMCLTYVFNYTGLALTTGTSAALIMATEPVWIAVLAVLVLRERLTPTRGLGVLLGLGGALLVIVSTTQPVNGADGSAAASAAMLGNALIAASLLWEASAVLTVKRLVARYPGPVIVTYEFLLGSLLLAPVRRLGDRRARADRAVAGRVGGVSVPARPVHAVRLHGVVQAAGGRRRVRVVGVHLPAAGGGHADGRVPVPRPVHRGHRAGRRARARRRRRHHARRRRREARTAFC